MPPLWLTIEIVPGLRASISVISELNEAVRPIAVLMTPMQFGPHSLIPPARLTASSSRWRARPASSPSANPPAQTTAAGIPAAMQSWITAVTEAAGTATTARSGGEGSSRKLGKHGSPATTVCPVFTGQTGPR